MMGHPQVEQAALFYEFSLEKHVPPVYLSHRGLVSDIGVTAGRDPRRTKARAGNLFAQPASNDW